MTSVKSLMTVAFMAGAAIAQLDPNLTMTPAEIQSTDSVLKASWCTSQQSVCTDLCTADAVKTNTCDSPSLNYTCLCSNGSAPGLQYYQNTIIFFECTTVFGACINASQNNQLETTACTTNIFDKCPTIPSTNISVVAPGSSPSSTSATPSSTSTGASTPAATSAAPAPTASKGAASLVSVQVGSGVFGLGLLLFGMLL